MTANKRIQSLGELWTFDLRQEAKHVAHRDGRLEPTVDDVNQAACKLIQAPRLAVSLFEKALRCNGWWKQLVDGSGEVEETNLDAVRYGTEPKTVKCVECGRSNPNPSLGK